LKIGQHLAKLETKIVWHHLFTYVVHGVYVKYSLFNLLFTAVQWPFSDTVLQSKLNLPILPITCIQYNIQDMH